MIFGKSGHGTICLSWDVIFLIKNQQLKKNVRRQVCGAIVVVYEYQEHHCMNRARQSLWIRLIVRLFGQVTRGLRSCRNISTHAQEGIPTDVQMALSVQ